jgi:hypothetical protein
MFAGLLVLAIGLAGIFMLQYSQMGWKAAASRLA